jgi:hypothetical protein
MTVFSPKVSWSRKLDVRSDMIDEFVMMLEERSPIGALWPVVAARRAGKTWTLRAIEDHFRMKGGPVTARYFDLRDEGDQRQFYDEKPDAVILLIDETKLEGDGADERAHRLVERCRELATAPHARRILIAMAPTEWDCLVSQCGGGPSVNHDDLQSLAPLTDQQAVRLARRAEWASELLERVPAAWKRNPFLLECLLREAEQNHLGPDKAVASIDVSRLFRSAIAQIREEFQYIDYVFRNSLTCDHQEAIRRIAAERDVDSSLCLFLKSCGLVGYSVKTKQASITDPLLAEHLPPPLRIHHVSDLHIGPKLASTGHAGDGETQQALGAAAGNTSIVNGYLSYVRTLPQKPNLLVISGDIAEYGVPDQYEQINDWLADIQKELAPHPQLHDGDPRVLVVSGNHDVNRSLVSDANPQARHQSFADAFNGFPIPHLEVPPDDRKPAIEHFRDARLEFVLLGSAELGQQFDDFGKSFSDLLDAACGLGLSEADREKALDAAKVEVRIDPGLVHHADLERLRSAPLPGNGVVRFVVLHHHVSPMPHFTDVGRFGGLLNAGQVKDACFASKAAAVLHGHMHSAWCACRLDAENHRRSHAGQQGTRRAQRLQRDRDSP